MVRILLLDDNAEFRSVVQTALELERYIVLTGRTGRDGLHLLETEAEPFDAVLCDLRMPELDGLGFLKLIRDDPRWQTLFFIVTSGSHEDQMKAMNSGADDFLEKPFKMGELIKRLKDHLGDT